MVDLAERKGQGQIRPSFLKVQVELATLRFQKPFAHFLNLALFLIVIF